MLSTRTRAVTFAPLFAALSCGSEPAGGPSSGGAPGAGGGSAGGAAGSSAGTSAAGDSGAGGSVAGSASGGVGGSGGAGGAGTGGTAGDGGAQPGGGPGGGSAGEAGAGGAGGGTSPTCGTRSGGALVTFRICDESLTLWITSNAFVTEAIRLRGTSGARIACFPGLIDGRDCDSEHGWHADPAAAYWSDFELETYFGCPSEVEQNRLHWVEQIGMYCGEHAAVTAVDDRR
jgi:hypothetical protein